MLSNRASKIKPSPTLAIDAKAKAMKAEGVDIVSFGVGEPDFDTPDNIKEAAIKAIRDGFTKYTPVGGIDPLKDAIIEKFRKDNNLNYMRDEIIVSCGAKHSLYNIAQALFGPGDEVLIPSPYWVSYPEQVVLNDAIPVFVKTYETDSFIVKPEAIESHITKKTKALILNSPSNPTGLTYNKKTLERIAEIVLKHNLYVISDEIYEKLLYDGVLHFSIASLGNDIKNKTIVVNGLSKAYAMTGWRIGYAAGPKEIIKAMTNIQSQSTSNPTSIAQKAAIEAITGPQDFINIMFAEFDVRRKFLINELNSIHGISCLTPTGAFYAFPNTSRLYSKSIDNRKISSSSDLALYLLERANVALVHGEAFGDDNYIRLSYAIPIDEIKKGVERIREAIGKLK
ncbi:MAG: aspartate aminotransferase [Nitrospirae bacterium CG_4_10_14_0_8_um_filter_41_23]|nr:pyridoxal phosphate-dependent aminotransferase [Nitrospirota bacterium]OIP61069.1 MAG: aspartate aminotransferase [Nitrospirae bacterium CG2_30_41_42]PIQ94846.1 MAG: aspartate aminotransferase [Nitrospirae bacterium CG11_big_fil_rev_8_21_14_0_20_41_14]PIV40998.1 MAG: aspartate aminotransferase [Nitrospirae bacterium CG02_land_8_20_14_3_00_41_53]PIW88029.1 MAG: aspartate aminotransferase [Nitrospirae bacterium CG_4_8_14_3_um_filter_41_47]PIY86049.1 MAG: aspartate aminotransferase [Nitrospira